MIELYDEYFKTVIDHMHKVFLNNQYINAIEQWYKCSGTKVSHQKTTKDFYIWIYKTGQARENRVCFIYENTREAKHAKKHLESYVTYLNRTAISVICIAWICCTIWKRSERNC